MHLKPVLATVCLAALVATGARAAPGVLAAAGANPLVMAAAEVAGPEALLRSLYADYDVGQVEAKAERTFSPALLALYREVEAAAAGASDIGLGFDPFINAQDFDTVTVDAIVVRRGEGGPTFADVRVTRFGEAVEMTYVLIEEPDGWKVDDIEWADADLSLRGLLEDIRSGQSR
jgi:hypothetical protein